MRHVTLWLHVSTLNGHHQANKEHFKVQKVIIQWDPIWFTVEYKIMYKEKLIYKLNNLN